MDEIGLLLIWEEYRSSITYVIVILTGVLFLNVVYFTDFWNEVRKNIIISSRKHIILSRTLRILFILNFYTTGSRFYSGKYLLLCSLN